jgi:hypothetical protein
MDYKVSGSSPIVTNKRLMMPGETLNEKDLPAGTNIDALIESGHLAKVSRKRAEKVDE